MNLEVYIVFLLATIVVVFSPGPAAITVASQGASNGAKKSLFGMLGVASANVMYFFLSATGIASLIIASNVLFSVIKWAGVLYLLYLGFSALLSKSSVIKIDSKASQARPMKLYLQGLIVELANPKALLYFSALIPQFINVDQSIHTQLLVMGLTCFVMDCIAYGLYGFFGDKISKGAVKAWMINLINKATGGFFIFIGIRMASSTINQS
jgi:homoserine/homoserine lactone efflux protein